MNEKQLSELLVLGQELRSVEFKGPGKSSDKEFLVKVARAVLAMSNHPGGGQVIIGVREKPTFEVLGLSAEELETWKHDDVADAVGRYADPSVTFSTTVVSYGEKRVVVLEVSEFDITPVLCKKSYPGTLQDGMLYVRPKGKVESKPVPDHAHMREVLDLATHKQTQRLLRIVGREASAVVSGSAARFDAQLKDGQDSELLQPILRAGYWRFVIRPSGWEPGRIQYDRLYPELRSLEFAVGGWTFPASVVGGVPHYLEGSVENRIDAHQEYWRIYTSGMFVFYGSYFTDYYVARGGFEFRLGDPREFFAVYDAVRRCSTFFRFASRFAGSPLGSDPLVIEVNAENLKGRKVWIEEVFRDSFPVRPQTNSPRFSYSCELTAAELLGSEQELALECVSELISRFGWENPRPVLQDIQHKLAPYMG